MTDATTDYSHWLNTFNVSKDPIEQWPVFVYTTEQGQPIIDGK
ncbi:hypothetical protein [Pseudoalteromonas holothuriae]|nr:hypothetical protein [Pseudoalteromonas sp. CIP111951]